MTRIRPDIIHNGLPLLGDPGSLLSEELGFFLLEITLLSGFSTHSALSGILELHLHLRCHYTSVQRDAHQVELLSLYGPPNVYGVWVRG